MGVVMLCSAYSGGVLRPYTRQLQRRGASQAPQHHPPQSYFYNGRTHAVVSLGMAQVYGMRPSTTHSSRTSAASGYRFHQSVTQPLAAQTIPVAWRRTCALSCLAGQRALKLAKRC